MRYWVGITDGDWAESLRRHEPDEVNFWQPSARAPRSMDAGWPFLFKLHAPRNFVVGGGFFVRFTVLPCFLAWDAFEEKNCAANVQELVARAEKYRNERLTPGSAIGCNILAEPFYFSEDKWIPVPEDWPRNVQRGFTYDTATKTGAAQMLPPCAAASRSSTTSSMA